MAQQTVNTIKLQDNSKERVAYDIMLRIAEDEFNITDIEERQKNPRQYWLKLYSECLNVYSKDSPPK